MIIMWFGKPMYCLAAFLTTEICAVLMAAIVVLAQAAPDMHTFGPLTPKAMTIMAYASMAGVIVGGVVQVLQLFVNSKSAKLEEELRVKAIMDEADKKVFTEKVELMKVQNELQRQHIVMITGWQNTLLNQKPGEPLGEEPIFHPDPATATPQAVSQAKTLPMVTTPVADVTVVPVDSAAEGVLKTASGIFRTGTSNAPIRENTEALKENTEAVKDASEKLVSDTEDSPSSGTPR